MEQEIQQATAIYQLVTEFFVNYSFQIIGALIILCLGFYVAHKVSNVVLRLCERKDIDITLSRFLASCSKIIVVIMVAIIALNKVGISVTPFLAAIGALSLGAGLALQGTLSNYGAGFNIILTRPFVVGDTITVQGVTGQVQEVHLAFTILNDEDNVRITIPNRHIMGEIIHNSHTEMLAVEKINIAQHNDPEKVIELIGSALKDIEEVDSGRAPQVGIEQFIEGGFTVGIRYWVPTDHYYQLRYRANKNIHCALKQAEIKPLIPQREIRML